MSKDRISSINTDLLPSVQSEMFYTSRVADSRQGMFMTKPQLKTATMKGYRAIERKISSVLQTPRYFVDPAQALLTDDPLKS